MKKKILIVSGGISKEREISLDTGKQVAKELIKNNYLVKIAEPDFELLDQINYFKPQIIFNALHGQFGEDGYIQTILETTGIPYTHSGVIPSAIAMDKELSKKIFIANNILTPKYILYLFKTPKLKLFNLIYKYSNTKELIISYQDDSFIYEIKEIPLITEKIFVSGKIKTSLYKAMKDQGLSEIVINEIIRIYSFDVDFQRDIYEGDKFEMIFTKKTDKDGETVQIEDPKYLMLSSRGTPLFYYLYDTDEFSEYFDEKGKGMTKSLMKTPINGARLSSSYGMRKHPISGYNKMHKGVDFAAPSGTPIFAAGNGVIEYAGRNGGYGKYIRIRHDSTYKTAYAHLKSYKKGMSSGVRVKQGDVIGYVGSTGKSTGPHLHYEIIVNGVQINPATLKLPSGRKLNEQQLNEFKSLVLRIDEEVGIYKNMIN